MICWPVCRIAKIILPSNNLVNKHTAVVIVSIAIIMATIGYSGLNTLLARNLQFRWHQLDNFDLLAVMFNGKFLVCNDSVIPVSFDSYSVKIFFDKQDLGTFTSFGAQISPHKSAIVGGQFETGDKQVAQMLFSSLDTALNNNDAAARIDPKKMHVTTTIQTKLIGLIPISTTQQYSGYDFVDIMNKKTSCDI